jgi:hypothetical protein
VPDNLLHPEYGTFLRLLRLLAYYAPEHYYHLPFARSSEDFDEMWVREHIEDLHLISQDDYLEHIYTHRHIEENLRREFLFNSDLIYLIGPLGSGKTSVALRLRKDLHSASLHRFYLAYIDVRHALSGRDQSQLAANDLREFLRRLVMDSYQADLFPYRKYPPPGRNPNIGLWAYLLDRDSQPPEAQGISQGLAEIQNRAAFLFDGYSAPKLEQGVTPSYYDWLEHQGPQNSEVHNLINDLNKHLDLKHLVSAARHVRGISHQIIWFDNVDALEYSQQDAIHDHLRAFQTNVAALASIVIALRDENIRHFDLRVHEPGAPPYGRKFIIERSDNDQYFSFPGHVLPPPSEETLRTAIRKKLDATRRLQSKKLKALYGLKSEKESELVNAKDKDLISKQIREINIEISNFGPAISTSLYNNITELSARTAEVLILEKASHLANNSLRDVFRIHRDFLTDLLRRGTDSNHRPVALDYKPWYLATLFLGWIRATERPFKLTLEDIFEHYRRWSEPGTRLIGCSLPYLIINTLWNIEIDKTRTSGRRAFPTLGDLLRKLNFLGYGEEAIRTQLNIQVQRSIVALRFPEQSFNQGDETQLYATYCGKCLTGSTFNSFGYLVECLEKAKAAELGAPEDVLRNPLAVPKSRITLLGSETGAWHQHLETEEAVTQLLPYLRGVAKMHIAEFVRISQTGELGSVGWLGRYRDSFGIPNDPEFRRAELPEHSRTGRKALQLEGMLGGLLSYVKAFPEAKKSLSTLLADYARALHDLDHLRELQKSSIDL